MSIIAVDLGGTRMKVGAVDEGDVSNMRWVDAHSRLGAAQALHRLAEVIRGYDLSRVSAIGLALPTLVDSRGTRVLVTMKGKFEGLHAFDLEQWSLANFSLPVRIENDAHAALLGEWKYGAARGEQNLGVITLGTGIGTSVMIGGKLLRGKHSQAGNLAGHFVLDPAGYPCVCGGRGCAEAQQHLTAVAAIAAADARIATSPLAKAPILDYAAIFAAASTDELARDLRDRAIAIWGAVVTSMVNQFDCEHVIIGGGIMRSADVILPALQVAASRACTPWGTARVHAAQLGDQAALLGMAALCNENLDYI